MPFGRTNALVVFQALVNDVLRYMLDQFVFVYLDDILIFFSDEQTHIQHVLQVLQHLLDHQLFVKAEKCFLFSGDSIQMDPAKASAVVG